MHSMPMTPKPTKTELAEEHKDREKDKEREKRNEAAKIQNKKAQEKDLPRFKHGENRVDTAKDSYEIVSELGAGSFGAVFGVVRKSDGCRLAMKCESVNMKRAILPHEAGVLLALGLLKSNHFVDMIDHGVVNDRFLFVVLTLVGRNLWDIRSSLPDKRFTLATTLRVAEQTLAGLRDLHRVGFLHRDIKPPNFAVGREGDENFHTVYVLDFGLCRKIAMKGKDLRTPRKECAFRGTTRYAAIAAHENKEQARKDDLESWWYMIAEMIVAEIPWKQCRGNERDNVKAMKMRLREDETFLKFLFRKCCYEQMSTILFYLDKLTYTSIPDYDFVYHHICGAVIVNNITPSCAPDWDPKNSYRGPSYKEGEPYIVKVLE